ncbi:MAG TPA: P-type conjugative transfer ATPase TrbB [Candidatus Baltobacteraceae bacterium]|nr:P-type conjugative transfer ATPase TrbB [Candidatus Baltobacteraceae bacterium]
MVLTATHDTIQVRTEDLAQQKRELMREKLSRELGSKILQALADDSVTEILLNPDGVIWLDRAGVGLQDSGERMSAVRAENLLGTIAAMLDTTIGPERPLLQGELPFDGSRFQGVVPPVSSVPIFSIRKRAAIVFTLDRYVADGILSRAYAEELRQAVAQRQNILIVGSTGSGKTTLTNALLAEIARADGDAARIVILEDTFELQCPARNVVMLHTSDSVDMTACLRVTMRLRPDRIIVGEVRDHAALALLKAWNTGHPGGCATIHANSAYGGLVRMEQLISEAPHARPNPALIADSIDIVVFIARTPAGRRVTEVARCTGFKDGRYALDYIPNI